MKINSPLLIIGIVLTLLAVSGLLLAGRLLYPPAVRIPVALADLPAGSVLTRAQFRLEEWNGLETATLNALYTADDFPLGAVTRVDLPAGSPLYKAYVETATTADFVTRLSLRVRAQGKVVMAVPVQPDSGGNLPRPGDEIDLLFAIGTLQADAVENPPEPTPSAAWIGLPAERESQPLTTSLPLPLATLLLENLPVLQIEQEQLTTPANYDNAAPAVTAGDTLRIYVAVTREQAETLAFLLHTGEARLVVHPAGLPEAYPGGVTWHDFAVQFFDHRAPPEAP